MDDLITVIIPVYNVETYLRKCLDSVLSQTYKNLEILLIDDGSTDNSPNICDEYSVVDYRIKVMHKSNTGVSDTRNLGIKSAKGKYIACIDSDDYVDMNYIQRLYGLIIKYNADISICRFRYVYGNKEDNADGKRDDVSMDKHEALKTLFIENEFGHYPHQKMFRTDIMKKHLYPIGKIYEDIATTYKMFSEASIIAYTKEQLYFYRQRKGSITSSDNKRNFDIIEHLDNIQNYMKMYYPELLQYTEVLKIFYYLHTLARIDSSSQNAGIYSKVLKYIKYNRQRLIRTSYIPKKLKVQLALTYMGVPFYRWVWNIKEDNKRRKIRVNMV